MNDTPFIRWTRTAEQVIAELDVFPWRIYGDAHEDERKAKLLCGRLSVFKQGSRVIKHKDKYIVQYWERSIDYGVMP